MTSRALPPRLPHGHPRFADESYLSTKCHPSGAKLNERFLSAKLGHYYFRLGESFTDKSPAQAMYCFQDAFYYYASMYNQGIVKDEMGKDVFERMLKCAKNSSNLDKSNPTLNFTIAQVYRQKIAKTPSENQQSDSSRALHFYDLFLSEQGKSNLNPVFFPREAVAEATHWKSLFSSEPASKKSEMAGSTNETASRASTLETLSQPASIADESISVALRFNRAQGFLQLGTQSVVDSNPARAMFAFREALSLYSFLYQEGYDLDPEKKPISNHLLEINSFLLKLDPKNATFLLDKAAIHLLSAARNNSASKTADLHLANKHFTEFLDRVAQVKYSLMRPFVLVSLFDAYFGRGWCLMCLGEKERAHEDFQKALQYADCEGRREKVNQQLRYAENNSSTESPLKSAESLEKKENQVQKDTQ